MQKPKRYTMLTGRELQLFLGLVAIILVTAGLIVGFLLHSRSKMVSNDTTSSTNSSDSANTGNISIDSNSSATDAATTLANLKNNPAYQNARTDIPYDELFRNIDQYKGTYVHYTGEVIQVLGSAGNWNLRVNITKQGTDPYTYYQDTVFVFSYAQHRDIENDIIDFTALVNGTQTYQSTLGGQITLPSLTIYEDSLVGRAEQ